MHRRRLEIMVRDRALDAMTKRITIVVAVSFAIAVVISASMGCDVLVDEPTKISNLERAHLDIKNWRTHTAIAEQSSTATPIPSATSVPEPTATPKPTATSTPTFTPVPPIVVTATPSRTPFRTPKPSRERLPTRVPTRTKTPTVIPTPTTPPTPTPVPDDFEQLTSEHLDKVARVLGIWDYQFNGYPYLNDVRLTGDELRWIRQGLNNYITREFMHRCLDGLEYPPLREELAKQIDFRGWATLEFLRDGSKYDYDLQMGINPDYVDDPNWYSIISVYRTGTGSDGAVVIAYMGLQRDTCEPRVRSRTDSGDVLDFRMEERTLDESGNLRCIPGFSCRLNTWVAVDRWKWYDPITNEELETGRIRCRGVYWLDGMGREMSPNCPTDETP